MSQEQRAQAEAVFLKPRKLSSWSPNTSLVSGDVNIY